MKHSVQKSQLARRPSHQSNTRKLLSSGLSSRNARSSRFVLGPDRAQALTSAIDRIETVSAHARTETAHQDHVCAQPECCRARTHGCRSPFRTVLHLLGPIHVAVVVLARLVAQDLTQPAVAWILLVGCRVRSRRQNKTGFKRAFFCD